MKAAFRWDDPFGIDDQLSADECPVRAQTGVQAFF